MSEITLFDIFATSYTIEEAPPPATKANTALLLIDIQVLAAPEYMAKKAVKGGLPEDKVNAALADYKERFYSAVDACGRLLGAAREHGIPPVHVKIEALSGDARDTGASHRMMGWKFPPGSEAARFLSQAEPQPGEIVLTKTVSGAFTGTNLDRVLRHMGIEHLIVCGFVTDECVETTFRDALDLGYLAFLISDATTTYFAEDHAHVVKKFGGWGLVQTTEMAITSFATLPEG